MIINGQGMSDVQIFEEFPKIPRLKRGCVITEKIDGTNGQIHIADDGDFLVGSRGRYITPEQDNYGFARWAMTNKEELMKLGPGRHFGEWWGSGIQRGYGLTNGDKRFSLFNVGRWREASSLHHPQCGCGACPTAVGVLPLCVSLVPVLYEGPFDSAKIEELLDQLRISGSVASPGFGNPEGLVVYHAAARSLFKVTLEKDEEPKGKNGSGSISNSPLLTRGPSYAKAALACGILAECPFFVGCSGQLPSQDGRSLDGGFAECFPGSNGSGNI